MHCISSALSRTCTLSNSQLNICQIWSFRHNTGL